MLQNIWLKFLLGVCISVRVQAAETTSFLEERLIKLEEKTKSLEETISQLRSQENRQANVNCECASEVGDLNRKISELTGNMSVTDREAYNEVLNMENLDRTGDTVQDQINTIFKVIRGNRRRLSFKCNNAKCNKLTYIVRMMNARLREIENLVPTLSGGGGGENYAAMEACFQDPTSALCTATYGSSGSLPTILGSKCDESTCNSIQSGTTSSPGGTTDACDTATCTTHGADIATLKSDLSTLSSKVDTNVGKISTLEGSVSDLQGSVGVNSNGISVISVDLTNVKSCFTDPSSAGCTAAYSGSSSLPGVLSAKCDASKCTALESSLSPLSNSVPVLTADVTSLKDCMSDPSSSPCTAAYGTPGSLPLVLTSKCDSALCLSTSSSVLDLEACMNDFTSAACTGIYSTSSSIPTKLSSIESCMADVDSPTCAASDYGTIDKVSLGGNGLVAWTQQLKKPSIITCSMGKKVLDNIASSPAEPNGCPVLTFYQQVEFTTCTQTEPDNTDDYHMQATPADTTYIQINKAGWYKIELSVFLKLQAFNARTNVEVFKISTKDSSASCATVASYCKELISMEGENDNTGTISTGPANSEGVFPMCDGDKIIVIFSRTGNTNTESTISGNGNESRTILVVTKVWFP